MTHNAGSELQDRMKCIRAKRIDRVAEIQNEAGRMTNWREHVKSAPMAALAGSAVLGFFAVRFASRLPTATAVTKQPDDMQAMNMVREPPLFHRTSIMSGAVRILCGIALAAGKNYLTQQLSAHSKDPKP
jgi:hypothetical protein